MTTLSVVIPALNEEAGIRNIVDRVLAVQPALRDAGIEHLELIVVDDGSTDRTAEIAAAQPGVRLLRHPANRGYGAALKTGFNAAQGEWIGFLDADGTYPPEYFPQLCRTAAEEQADIVIGSRMAGAESQMPAVRRLGNRIFAGLVSLISAQSITDSASGMRIFRKSLLERLYPLPDGLNLTPVMSTRALHEQLKMVETPIPYSERVGRSKLSVVRDGMLFAQSIVWTALSYNPVRILGLIGMGALAATAVAALSLIVLRLQGISSLGPVGAFVVFAGVALAVAGLSVVMLGISFNYFVALFHRTPVRQGLFGRPLIRRRLEPAFGPAGVIVLALGIALSVAALLFGLGGMAMERLWFYYLTSAGLVLIGVQLIVAWVQMQVLEALSIREQLVHEDLGQKAGKETAHAWSGEPAGVT
ncbi:MAG: glycosyltransferase family 2 protein [Chloroflexota bacterium]|nr:glycosyltransferase family 2 protein [Chloroflexota bacterium]